MHIAFVEGTAWVQEDVHVVVRVVLEPDADSRRAVESEVVPGPPQCFYPGDCFGVVVPLDAPFGGAAVDVADVRWQELFVQELFG